MDPSSQTTAEKFVKSLALALSLSAKIAGMPHFSLYEPNWALSSPPWNCLTSPPAPAWLVAARVTARDGDIVVNAEDMSR